MSTPTRAEKRPPPKRGEPETALSALWSFLKWNQQELTPEERREVLSQLFFERERRLPYLRRFATLLSLSVAIASFGLLTDSTAVVIGAMLVAPLMTPIQAVAASMVMGWERRQLNSLLLVAVAALWSVLLSYFFGLLGPDRIELPNEVLSRTSPTLFDLGIALAAGAAGAYTIVRRESSAIPGVAVAVALVPPLAVIGITLENDEADLAAGALLLFATNLAAIVFAAAIVLLITGFAPRALLELRGHRVRRGVVIAIIAVALISIPLGIHSKQIIDDARDRHEVEEAIATWLSHDEDLDIVTVDIDGNEVIIDIVGPRQPGQLETLDELISEHMGDDTTVSVRWVQRADIVAGED